MRPHEARAIPCVTMARGTPSSPIPGKLPLEDPRWTELSGPWPELSETLPGRVRELAKQPELELSKSSTWAHLHDLIYHQHSCYESTYAAVPHLVEIGLDLPPDRSADLWISLGFMAATYRVFGEPIPEDLAPAFHAALSIGEVRCLDALLSEPWNRDESSYLALAALALSGHRMGFLITTNIMLGEGELEGVCPSCKEYFVILFRDDGIATYGLESTDPPVHSDETQPRRLSALQCTGSPRETPWRRVAEHLASDDLREQVPEEFLAEWQRELDAGLQQCRMGLANADDRCVACVAGGLLAVRGEVESSSRLLRLSGGVRCPGCRLHCNLLDAIMPVWPHLRRKTF